MLILTLITIGVQMKNGTNMSILKVCWKSPTKQPRFFPHPCAPLLTCSCLSALDEELSPQKSHMKNMIEAMKEKFENYWADCNFVLAITTILDPRRKMMIVEFATHWSAKKKLQNSLRK